MTETIFPSIVATVRDDDGNIFNATPASIVSADLEPSRTPEGRQIVNAVVELELAGGTATTLRYRNVESAEIRTLIEVAGVANWSRLVGRPVIALFDYTGDREIGLGSVVRGLTPFLRPGELLSLPPGTVVTGPNNVSVTPTND